MRPLEGGFEPHDEVDELRWLPAKKAVKKLTYDHDKELVERAMGRRRLGWRRR
jgi:8-oxo-dGTP diphosphatase